jgi:hypothetical protein
MWDWLARLWDYLRRLIVGDDDGGIVGNGDPTENEALPDEDIEPQGDEAVGRELQEFLLELLKDGNLKEFQGAGRNRYLNERRNGFSAEAWRVLSMGDMRALEAHIGAIPGSRAVLMYVVCPPM